MAEEGMLTKPAPTTKEDVKASQTFTFFKGHELGDANSGYLMGTRDSSQLTEQELRDYFDSDEASMLRQSFGDFDNYLGYMTEREQLLQSGDYDIGSWDEASGALTEDELMLLGGEDLTFYGDDETFEDLEKQRFAERNSAYNNWLNSEQNQALLDKYGVGGKIYNQDGDEYSWNGSAYVKTVKEQAGIADYTKLAIGAAMGAFLGPALGNAATGSIGAAGSTTAGSFAQGAVNNVLGSALSQGLTTGSVDISSLGAAAITGGIGGVADAVRAGDLAGTALDNAVWDLSGALNMSPDQVTNLVEGIATGAITGSDLESMALGAVKNFTTGELQSVVQSAFGDSIDVPNLFREGETTIPIEAFNPFLETAVDAAFEGQLEGEDVIKAFYEYAQDGGSFAFLYPDLDLPDIDLDIFGNMRTPSEIKAIEDYARAAGSAAEDVVRAGGRAVDENVIQRIRKVLPHGTTPDIDLPEGPDIDLPDGPDIDLPGINLGGGGGGGLSNYTGYMGGFDYQLPQSRMINYVPNQPTDAMQMSEGMLLGMAKNRGRV